MQLTSNASPNLPLNIKSSTSWLCLGWHADLLHMIYLEYLRFHPWHATSPSNQESQSNLTVSVNLHDICTVPQRQQGSLSTNYSRAYENCYLVSRLRTLANTLRCIVEAPREVVSLMHGIIEDHMWDRKVQFDSASAHMAELTDYYYSYLS